MRSIKGLSRLPLADLALDQQVDRDAEEVPPAQTQHFRAIFISDCHLGTPGCQAAALLDFLRRAESDYLYLVGDIIDGWQLKRRWYWSLARFLKLRVKNAVKYINAFEDALAREARTHGFDGVVCGHIHHAEVRLIGDVLYCNSGDWVDSLTALVEAQDGTLSVLRWNQADLGAGPREAPATDLQVVAKREK